MKINKLLFLFSMVFFLASHHLLAMEQEGNKPKKRKSIFTRTTHYIIKKTNPVDVYDQAASEKLLLKNDQKLLKIMKKYHLSFSAIDKILAKDERVLSSILENGRTAAEIAGDRKMPKLKEALADADTWFMHRNDAKKNKELEDERDEAMQNFIIDNASGEGRSFINNY